VSQRRLRLLAAAVVAVPLLVFPLALLAKGAPPFPSRDDCAVAATGDAPDLDVVYARLDELAAAETLLAAVTGAGFTGASIELDACGLWKVAYDPIESFAQGEELAEQVRAAGFEARVEVGA
jgi:hypothetical protein